MTDFRLILLDHTTYTCDGETSQNDIKWANRNANDRKYATGIRIQLSHTPKTESSSNVSFHYSFSQIRKAIEKGAVNYRGPRAMSGLSSTTMDSELSSS